MELIEKVKRIFGGNDDLSIGVDLEYFDYQYGGGLCSGKFYSEIAQGVATRNAPLRLKGLAWAFQYNLEECLLKIARGLHKKAEKITW